LLRIVSCRSKSKTYADAWKRQAREAIAGGM
jgi:hypothetical protein